MLTVFLLRNSSNYLPFYWQWGYKMWYKEEMPTPQSFTLKFSRNAQWQFTLLRKFDLSAVSPAHSTLLQHPYSACRSYQIHSSLTYSTFFSSFSNIEYLMHHVNCKRIGKSKIRRIKDVRLINAR